MQPMTQNNKMEDKKGPLPGLEAGCEIPGYGGCTEAGGRGRRSTSGCFMFILLATFVFALGCFAVYTAVSVGSWEKTESLTGCSHAARLCNSNTAKQNTGGGNSKPNIQLEITINGQRQATQQQPLFFRQQPLATFDESEEPLSDVDKPTIPDEFSTLNNFLKKITGADTLKEETSSSEERTRKPKTISIVKWEFRKLPPMRPESSELPFQPNFPFNLDAIMNSFFGPPQMALTPKTTQPPKTQVEPRNQLELRNSPEPRPQPEPKNKPEPPKNLVIISRPIKTLKSSEENIFPKTIFKDFQDILSNIDKIPFNSQENVPKMNIPQTTNKPIFIPFHVPFGMPIFTPRFKPREEVTIFKKIDQLKPFEKYSNEISKNMYPTPSPYNYYKKYQYNQNNNVNSIKPTEEKKYYNSKPTNYTTSSTEVPTTERSEFQTTTTKTTPSPMPNNYGKIIFLKFPKK